MISRELDLGSSTWKSCVALSSNSCNLPMQTFLLVKCDVTVNLCLFENMQGNYVPLCGHESIDKVFVTSDCFAMRPGYCIYSSVLRLLFSLILDVSNSELYIPWYQLNPCAIQFLSAYNTSLQMVTCCGSLCSNHWWLSSVAGALIKPVWKYCEQPSLWY